MSNLPNLFHGIGSVSGTQNLLLYPGISGGEVERAIRSAFGLEHQVIIPELAKPAIRYYHLIGVPCWSWWEALTPKRFRRDDNTTLSTLYAFRAKPQSKMTNRNTAVDSYYKIVELYPSCTSCTSYSVGAQLGAVSGVNA